MIIQLPNDEQPIKYRFKFYKNHIYRKRTEMFTQSNGSFSLTRKESEKFKNSLNYLFNLEEYIQKGVKDPLVYDIVNWIFNLELKGIGISSKERIKSLWKRYRDKYRNKQNIAGFLAIESLYFKTPLGMEFTFLSNSPYLVFFIDIFEKEVIEGSVIKGIDLVFLPMAIPVSTWYKCIAVNEKYIELEGWISLNDDMLESLIKEKQFIKQTRPYHITKDFTIESNIKIRIKAKTGALHTASFKLQIDGEKGELKEEMSYELQSN